MARFTKKPIEIEAIQFTGSNWPTVNKFVGKIFRIPETGEMTWGFGPADDVFAAGVTATVWDRLHSTWVGVKPGQWIIKGIKGEFYPCDDHVFNDTYEKVD